MDKGKIAAETEIIKEKLAENLAVFTSSLQENQAQSAFIRALYADGIREYSTKQAVALRQSYLVIFEQHSSVIDTEGMTILERVELARQLVMQPLREHLGILDEETINKITSIQNELVRLRDNHPEDIKSKKNCYYNTAEDARKFVKADKISYRHSLISQTIEERKSD